VRHARHQLLSRALRDPYFDSSACAREKIRFISDLLRPNAPDIPIADLGAYLTATPQGPSKFAAVLSECTRVRTQLIHQVSAAAKRMAER
jgi:hypothetical protein